MNTYEKMKKAFDKYNPTADMLNTVYGLDSNKNYDVKKSIRCCQDD